MKTQNPRSLFPYLGDRMGWRLLVSLSSISSPRRPSVMPAGVIAAACIVIALWRADGPSGAAGAALEHQEA
jgi:hypothetical protein